MTNTTLFLSDLNLVPLAALVYRWDGVKRTKASAYTHYLTSYLKDYIDCSRSIKKKQKMGAVSRVYYVKAGISLIYADALKKPTPICDMDFFDGDNIPVIPLKKFRFERYFTEDI